MSNAAKILVIDDDPDIYEFCRAVLENEGYAVLAASNGADGIAAARKEQPDLIILDIMMEEADSGFAVAQAVGASCPVLMLSSIACAADASFDTSFLPISDLTEKPIAPQVLLDKVARLLEQRGRNT